jgi:hypothetical protein
MPFLVRAGLWKRLASYISPAPEYQGSSALQPERVNEAEHQRELARLQAEFPAFEIWREHTGYGTVYIARSRALGTHPHTVLSSDPAKIRSALAESAVRPEPTRQVSAEPPSPDVVKAR